MEELLGFFQGDLEKDFGFEDDHVIESLYDSMEELKRSKFDLPPPPSPDANERPTKPFGVFVTPTINQLIGRQAGETGTGSATDKLVLPADGGPVIPPRGGMRTESRDAGKRSSVASSLRSRSGDNYDTTTDGGRSSRRHSLKDDYRSSQTSFVDNFIDIDNDDNNINTTDREREAELEEMERVGDGEAFDTQDGDDNQIDVEQVEVS